MGLYKNLIRLFHRIKNPVSLPEDIGKDLGIQILYNELSFKECIQKLVAQDCRSKYLSRFMPRQEVETLFKSAIRKETFNDISLFSYYIYDGWLAFKLVFDEKDRLRRVYLQHQALPLDGSEEGVEMCLG
jgi:hypothetical protein